MKAIVQSGYGSPGVFELRKVEKPVVGEGGVFRVLRRLAHWSSEAPCRR